MRIYIALILINLYYAFISIVTKLTSQQSFLSFKYVMGVCVTVLMLGGYAIMWQQILKHVELNRAFVFKGLSLVFILLISFFVFSEAITTMNVVIISGILLYTS